MSRAWSASLTRSGMVRPAGVAGRTLLESATNVYAIAGIVLCTILTGFFSLASYALRTFSRAQLEELLEDPSGRGRLERLERDLTALRLTASLCRLISLLGLLLTLVLAVGGPDGGWPTLLTAAALALGIFALVGIAIPHAWALYASERFLAATMGLLSVLRYALYPLVAVMEALDFPIRRLSGVRDDENENGDSAKQEILHAASEGRADGTVDQEEVEMIESVMAFGQTRVAEIMTPRTDIFALPVSASFGDATAEIIRAGHTRVPVYDGDLDNIIGVLYAKDLLQHVGKSRPPELREIMRKPYFVPESKQLNDLLREFKARKVHLAVVLDEYGGTAGLSTVEDLIEEIVGDISDEYDHPQPATMKAIDERTVEIDGRVHIDDLNDAMKLDIPEDEDYDTVAGLVFSELGYVPAVQEQLRVFGARFTVLDADERRINRLRVEVLGDGKSPRQ